MHGTQVQGKRLVLCDYTARRTNLRIASVYGILSPGKDMLESVPGPVCRHCPHFPIWHFVTITCRSRLQMFVGRMQT